MIVMMGKIKQFWINKPLKSILILALLVRLIAVIFSNGYGWHDDHFLVIEASQSWADGKDWDNWLPNGQLETWPNKEPVPSGHSLLYAGIHYVLFSIMNFLGINNPDIKIMLIRLLHALFSLLIISFSYKITKRYSDERIAKQVGLILALLWFMPFFSVRNLVEFVCIPFILWGTWLIVKDKAPKINLFVWAGLLMGVAFSIRYQTIVFAGGVGLVLLFTNKVKEAFIFGAAVLFSIILVQGGIDLFVWGRPFAEFQEYVKYNLAHKGDYGTNVWYMYTTVLGGMLLLPLGVVFFFGWFSIIKKYPLLFWPSFLFFMFHNLFSNKQERFILPILPFFVIAGAIGWWQFMDKSKFWQDNKMLFKGMMVFFWTFNFIALPIVSTTYSKRSRCESMNYIGTKTNAKSILLEDTNRGSVDYLPNFYSGRYIKMYKYAKPSINGLEKLTYSCYNTSYTSVIQTPEYFSYNDVENPDYVLFIGEKRLEQRLVNLKKYYPDIEYETTINPSYMDMLMRRITPSNNNQLVFIYKIN